MTDQTVAENESICEKLLGWRPVRICGNRIKEWLDTPYGDDGAQWHTVPTPYFTTWADAGLILQEFERQGCDWDMERTEFDEGFKTTIRVFAHRKTLVMRDVDGTFNAIRAAALEYINAVKP